VAGIEKVWVSAGLEQAGKADLRASSSRRLAQKRDRSIRLERRSSKACRVEISSQADSCIGSPPWLEDEETVRSASAFCLVALVRVLAIFGDIPDGLGRSCGPV